MLLNLEVANIKIVIRTLSQNALHMLEYELDPMQHWKANVVEVDHKYHLYDVEISDYAQISTHIDSITVDCGGHLAFLELKDFERIEIL